MIQVTDYQAIKNLFTRIWEKLNPTLSQPNTGVWGKETLDRLNHLPDFPKNFDKKTLEKYLQWSEASPALETRERKKLGEFIQVLKVLENHLTRDALERLKKTDLEQEWYNFKQNLNSIRKTSGLPQNEDLQTDQGSLLDTKEGVLPQNEDLQSTQSGLPSVEEHKISYKKICILFLFLLLIGGLFFIFYTLSKKDLKTNKTFKVIIMPFKQLCQHNQKNYDVGYVIKERLNKFATKDSLNISVEYLEEFDIKNFNYQKAENIRKYEAADMIIYGTYQTDICSPEGDQICLNYITDYRWGLDSIGINLTNEYYAKGGLEELKKGVIQEKIEKIVIFISILSQIKSKNYSAYREYLQEFLKANVNFDLKVFLCIKLADKLFDDRDYIQALNLYKKSLSYIEKDINYNLNNFGIHFYVLKQMGVFHARMKNFNDAIRVFKKNKEFIKYMLEAHPNNSQLDRMMVYNQYHLGHCYIDLKEKEKARSEFKICLERLKHILSTKHPIVFEQIFADVKETLSKDCNSH